MRTHKDLSSYFLLSIHSSDIYLANNKVLAELSFGSSSFEKVEFTGNEFHKPVGISDVIFPEFNNYLPIEQFKGGFGVKGSIEDWYETNRYFKTGEYEDVKSLDLYDNLVNSYQRVYLNYRQRAELISANAAYVSMKEIMLNRERYLYEQDKTYSNFLKYQLTKLMKYYTDHGTNPTKAIAISSYIILAFAIFYFFFPSEWDTTSKSKLISNFNDFRKKNEKGYIKPFFVLIVGFGLSLINALTLSLNAFVTLGFGTIPTKGLARYVCIIQGFIGWFLLSIFTVALINQVLA